MELLALAIVGLTVWLLVEGNRPASPSFKAGTPADNATTAAPPNAFITPYVQQLIDAGKVSSWTADGFPVGADGIELPVAPVRPSEQNWG